MKFITQPIILLIMLSIGILNSHAQTFEEWFRQKETQIKYLVEQVGALKAYGEVVNKGYDIAHNGLTNVFSSKRGDYLQHSFYFLSLRKVRSGIKTYSKVLSILSMKAAIENQYRQIQSLSTELLNDRERNYVNTVYAGLIDGCNDLADGLDMIVKDDRLQLKDDERIQWIDKIYLQMQDRYEFSQSFGNEIKLLVINRGKEGNEVNKLYSLYGIK